MSDIRRINDLGEETCLQVSLKERRLAAFIVCLL